MNPDSRTTSADSVLPTSTNSSQSSSAALIIDPEAVLAHDSRRRPPPRIRLFRWFRDVVVPWVQGPDPPVDVAFKPLFPNVQEWPSEVVERFIKTSRMKVLALVIYFLTWVVTFGIVVHYSRFADEISGQRPQEQLSCNAAFWSKNNACGIDGINCRPFDKRTFSFRCPSNCLQSGQVLNPRAVGDSLVSYRPFVVGGPDPLDQSNITYRADSFICPSAVHAGIISNRYGGCGIVTQTGTASSYPSSIRHGVTSIPFDASFPSSYTFIPQTEYTSTSCRDLRWHLFIVSVPFTILTIILLPTLPGTVFAAIFTGTFFHVALASDPPFLSDPHELISRALSRFLPAAFIAAVLWRHCLRESHRHPILLSGSGVIEKAIFLLGGLWIGALNNITFEILIPINRLTARDLNEQRGAKAALAIVCTGLFLCIILQIYHLRLAGKLPKMLGLYLLLCTSLGLLAAIPGNSLRIHHYILALLLLPGCRIPTRPSLFFQGILLGLFINGVARWGFAGIVETPGSLQGDGLFYSSVPRFNPPPIIDSGNVTVQWNVSDVVRAGRWPDSVDGVSLLVNDVERGRVSVESVLQGGGEVGEWTVPRREGEKVYVRMAWLRSVVTGKGWDYTRAGVVERDGTWKKPEDGWS